MNYKKQKIKKGIGVDLDGNAIAMQKKGVDIDLD